MKKKNKKVYNFTDKQRRRDRSLDTIHFHTVGRYCKQRASRTFRIANKRILRKVMQGEEDICFIPYRKYMWWDF